MLLKRDACTYVPLFVGGDVVSIAYQSLFMQDAIDTDGEAGTKMQYM